MKKIIMIVLMLAMTALYAEGDFKGLSESNAGRLGIGLGGSNSVSGLSVKFYLSNNTAVQGVLGRTYGLGDGFSISGDFIMDITNLIEGNKDFLLPFYVGAGVNYWTYSWGSYNYNRLGVSGVAGVAFQLKSIPLELSVEIRPTIYLTGGDDNDNHSNFYISGGGAIRWFF